MTPSRRRWNRCCALPPGSETSGHETVAAAAPRHRRLQLPTRIDEVREALARYRPEAPEQQEILRSAAIGARHSDSGSRVRNPHSALGCCGTRHRGQDRVAVRLFFRT